MCVRRSVAVAEIPLPTHVQTVADSGLFRMGSFLDASTLSRFLLRFFCYLCMPRSKWEEEQMEVAAVGEAHGGGAEARSPLLLLLYLPRGAPWLLRLCARVVVVAAIRGSGIPGRERLEWERVDQRWWWPWSARRRREGMEAVTTG
ncbi:hypothetical protein GUJ93_ZPchr0078g15 [Zizania palustris]|uniref:Uncharacterized protein n=1 Tax=Zizania palustris TaxID=103762 RepID=A0A8J5RF75_ZIZPA|nr:hypothetical protein GUJ93_ZPchr0078g15 [Zizania palustris]